MQGVNAQGQLLQQVQDLMSQWHFAYITVCDQHAIGSYSYQAVLIAVSAMLRVSNSGQKSIATCGLHAQQMQVALGWLSSK